jgi:5-methylcytosine-specific restriction protein A
MDFVKGQVYRRRAIHEKLGGQQQGGISTPKEHPLILIFSGDNGETFGYSDGWRGGYFTYTGEGQVGEMEFVRGNASIRDHESAGKAIHLFFNAPQRSHVVYHGEMRCVDWEEFQASDREGNTRSAIRFILEEINDQTDPRNSDAGTVQNRQRPPNSTERRGLVTSRVGQGYYRQRLVEKFGGKCAVNRSGPKELMIASHIVPWSRATDEERLDVENGILLSPNLDALFDKCLISFADDGSVLLSPLLTSNDAENLGVTGSESIDVTLGMIPYLARHREELRR